MHQYAARVSPIKKLNTQVLSPTLSWSRGDDWLPTSKCLTPKGVSEVPFMFPPKPKNLLSPTSASDDCAALIQSPCRIDLQRLHRRKLYQSHSPAPATVAVADALHTKFWKSPIGRCSAARPDSAKPSTSKSPANTRKPVSPSAPAVTLQLPTPKKRLSISTTSSTTCVARRNSITPVLVPGSFRKPSSIQAPDTSGFGRKLGIGGFGSVFTGWYNGQRSAIKQIRGKKLSGDYSLCAELHAFRLPPHPNVARVLSFGAQHLVYEYVGRRNLQHLLNNPQEDAPLPIARFAADVAAGLAHCHYHRLLHLDVKPSNILVTDDMKCCKVGDFGCSYLQGSTETFSANSLSLNCGTLIYRCPELLRGRPPTTKSDVYSYGILLWQLFSGSMPYQGLPGHSIVYCVVSRGLRPDIAEIPTQLQDLVVSCWRENPDERPEMADIKI